MSLGLPFLYILPTPLVLSLLSLSKCILWQKVLIRSWIFLLFLLFLLEPRIALEGVGGPFSSVVVAAASTPTMVKPSLANNSRSGLLVMERLAPQHHVTDILWFFLANYACVLRWFLVHFCILLHRLVCACNQPGSCHGSIYISRILNA